MNCRKISFIVLFISLFTAVNLKAEEVRSKININRDWKFVLGDWAGAQNLLFNDSDWGNISIPHSFSMPYFLSKQVYDGYGWYRKEVEMPASWTGKNVTLEFEASFIETEVYVNGTYLGKHVGGYTGFFFDITNNLKKGKNTIAVRVNNLWNARVAPRAGDHQFSGGIYRDVFLNVTDKLHVDCYGTFIYTPQVNKKSAVCNSETEVRNNHNEDKECTVKTEIKDANGKVVASVSSKGIVPKSGVKIFKQTLPPLKNPKLWSPETPNLYKAVTTVIQNGKQVDKYETKFGVRWFEWTTDKGFFLNGEHFYLRGANVHQDQAGWGDAVTNAALRRDVQMMKDAGFNCIRGSHYPHDPAFSEACDEIGIILFQENAFWGMGGGSGDRDGWGGPSSSCYPPKKEDQPYFDKSVLAQLKEMIKIHRNHASIAAWSMSNEPFFTDQSTLEPMRNLLNMATDSSRVWDPTRTVAIGGAQRGEIDKLGKGAIAFYNGDGASLYQNPGVPSLVSEYGSTTAHRPGKFFAGWGDILKSPEGSNNPWNPPMWRSGHVIWCGFDHGTIGGVGLATMGMVDYFRLPKRQYYWYVEALKNGNRNPQEPQWPAEGVPAKLRLEASNTILKSTNGTDDAQIIVTVLNSEGKHISNNIPVELAIVSGPGEFPTGSVIKFMPPSDYEESDITIRDGQAAIAFRSYHAGTTVIEARAPGVESATITITTEGSPVWVEGVTPKTKERPYKRYVKQIGDVPPITSSEMLLAKNRPSWVSSTQKGTSKANVNDDNSSTIWKPEAGDSEKWWKLALEASYCVNQIQLEFPSEDAYRYIIEVSGDDVDWKTVVDQTESSINDKVRTACGNFGCDIAFIRIKFVSNVAGLAEVRVGGSSTLPFKKNLLTSTIIGADGLWNDSTNL